MSAAAGWRSYFGGRRWRLTPDGVETEDGGVLRTAGKPVTMRRVLDAWGDLLASIADRTRCPLPVLMMTVATEGALRWTGTGWAYPAVRIEPGWTSDAATPHRISVGPMHVLISTARAALRDATLTRPRLQQLDLNLLAGASYMAQAERTHGWDPVLVAACYNAGGLHAARPGSAYHNPWHLRSYGNHLDRAARWFGDAVAALREREPWPAEWPRPRVLQAPYLPPVVLQEVRTP